MFCSKFWPAQSRTVREIFAPCCTWACSGAARCQIFCTVPHRAKLFSHGAAPCENFCSILHGARKSVAFSTILILHRATWCDVFHTVSHRVKIVTPCSNLHAECYTVWKFIALGEVVRPKSNCHNSPHNVRCWIVLEVRGEDINVVMEDWSLWLWKGDSLNCQYFYSILNNEN